jgi:hypothetical protein
VQCIILQVQGKQAGASSKEGASNLAPGVMGVAVIVAIIQ